MKNFIIVAVIAVLGVGGYLVISKDSDQTSNSTASSKVASVERYETYSEEAFASSASNERIIFFHAGWCPTCIEYDKDIKATGVPEGITVLKADYDKDLDLRKKYEVTVQSTFVHIDKNGEVVKRWPFGAGMKDVSDLFSQVI